jgi:hypothetical protein
MRNRKHSSREVMEAVARIANEAGASVEFEVRGKGQHNRAHYTFNERTRFDVISDNAAALPRTLCQAKRTLRSLGAAL